MNIFKENLSLATYKCIIISSLLTFFLTASACAQLSNYLKARGKNLAEMTHVSNDFMRGTIDVDNQDYVVVTIFSKDNVFSRDITTKLRLIKGFGNLYISDIVVDADNDIVDPFEGFGIKAKLLSELYRKIERETYDKLRYEIRKNFNTDFKEWSGKMWALLALNLDYLDYLLQ